MLNMMLYQSLTKQKMVGTKIDLTPSGTVYLINHSLRIIARQGRVSSRKETIQHRQVEEKF